MRSLLLATVIIPLAILLFRTPVLNLSRGPASVATPQLAERIQQIDLDLEKLRARQWELRQQTRSSDSGSAESARLDSEILRLTRRRADLTTSLSSRLDLSSWEGTDAWLDTTTSPLIDHVETFTITDPTLYRAGTTTPPFPLEHRLFRDYVLRLENKTEIGLTGGGEHGGQPVPMRGRLECDAPMIYEDGFLFFSKEVRSAVYEFDWHNNRKNGQKLLIRFTPEVSRCVFQFRDRASSSWTFQVKLRALDELVPSWNSLSNHLEVCPKPIGFKAKDTTSFFWSQDFSHVSCPRTFKSLVQLRPPIKALNAKIRGLTGADVPKKILETKDPRLPLDFTKAPKFDVIWVSSLNFSADLYGSLLAQALRYHGERGTQIRILVPWATTMAKDKRLLADLMRGLPNVKLQLYEFEMSSGMNGNWLDEFHRVNHVKVLLGYSADKPENDFLVTGGRNIRDSYLFHLKPNYRQFPWLTNYAEGEEPFIYYDDYEIELRGEAVVRSTLAQMLSLWNRDTEAMTMRPTNLNVAKVAGRDQIVRLASLAEETPVVRHVVSLPFADDHKLETFYVDMINSAKQEILLTTPYFLPSERLSEAFSNAAKRGVKIKILTRIQLAGDGVPAIAEDINKRGINRHLMEIEMYEWTAEDSILHAKLMVIDQNLSFVSSVNMNHRSFLHDTEGGMLILNRKIARNLRADVLDYFKSATRITSQRQIGWLNGLLINWAQNYF